MKAKDIDPLSLARQSGQWTAGSAAPGQLVRNANLTPYPRSNEDYISTSLFCDSHAH